jgi:hypothetical protein
VIRHLIEGLSANEQNLAISVKKEYDDPRKCSGFDHDAGFLGQPWKATAYHLTYHLYESSSSSERNECNAISG